MCLDAGTVHGILDALRRDPLNVFQAIGEVLGSEDHGDIDTRIQAVVNHVSAEENCRHGLKELAAVAGISPGRLTHLFTQEMGISLKHYCLWTRTLFAIDTMRSTRDLTTVALACGFSDLSHLSRTFRNMFGMTLRQIFLDDRSVQVEYFE